MEWIIRTLKNMGMDMGMGTVMGMVMATGIMVIKKNQVFGKE
jgi:hypothetical protein